MRPSSPLSLLLFLQLSTAFPVSRECVNSQSCNSLHSVKDTFSLSHPKPSDPRDPHFPNHQKLPIPTFVKPTTTSPLNDEYFAEEGAFDNAPTTPSNDISADEALSAETPLSSSYLQSLTRTSYEDAARPSMPTSALPTLRKEDARKYWEEKPGGLGMNEGKPGCGNSNVWPGTAVGYRTRLAHLDMGGRNDFMVVGIVVVFLLVVCILESVERFGNRTSRRGEIFLEDDETYAFIVKKPRDFYQNESVPNEKNSRESEYKEYKDDETVVAEDFNTDNERES